MYQASYDELFLIKIDSVLFDFRVQHNVRIRTKNELD
jgi:hypothetical protein